MWIRFWSVGWHDPGGDDLQTFNLGTPRRRWSLDVDRLHTGYVRIAAVMLSLLIWAMIIGLVLWWW
jgi:hypothetical protein